MVEELEPSLLTGFQTEVARAFFALPAARGFLLTGGAALLAHHLTHRPTRDLDLLTTRETDVPAARDAFEAAAAARGWSVTRVQDGATFCRLEVHGGEELLVDLMVDAPPHGPPTMSLLGPTLAPEDLAGRKLLALFDRAAPRDFVDVYELVRRFDRQLLLDRAAAVDLGFDTAELARQMRLLDRYADRDLPCTAGMVDDLRRFFREWCRALE